MGSIRNGYSRTEDSFLAIKAISKSVSDVSLRDLFAMHIITSLLNKEVSRDFNAYIDDAELSYKIADAMINARGE